MDAAQKEFADEYFENVLFPVLTPLAVDRSRPFPMLLNKSLNLGVKLKKEGETAFARGAGAGHPAPAGGGALGGR